MAIIDKQGKTDFQALQNYMRRPQQANLVYIIFDILALDGKDLREKPLSYRKEILKSLLQGAPSELYFSPSLQGQGSEIFAAACKLGLEGIVAKRADSVYCGQRSNDWLKIKCDNRQEFVIGGYTLSDKKREGVSSLLLGYFKEDKLHYIGRAGSGIAERIAADLQNKFKGLQAEHNPFATMPKARSGERITWLKTELVAEIKYNGLTEDNLLRQASYKGLREDKEATAVTMEKELLEVEQEQEQKDTASKQKGNANIVQGVKVSNPDKLIFEQSGIKKIDIIKYYESVASAMLPYLEGRLLSIVRCPKGTSEPCFYKKHPLPSSKDIMPFTITSSSGESEEYFYINSGKGIISEVQMGTIEFHLWASKADTLEQPDLMVFDLDPDEGMEIAQVRQGVRHLKEVLDRLSLTSFLKTSGGKGYHIVLPFAPSGGWEAFSGFARRVAEAMEQLYPDRYTSNMRKEKRKGRIFIDWVRNGRGATSVAPYSLRAKQSPTISAPISWQQLDSIAPDSITLANINSHLTLPNPWTDFFKIEQRIK